VRLEGSGLPGVEGLLAFDFGPPGAPTYPGFEACSQQTRYSDERGYGWIGGDFATIAYMPDALTGDCAGGEQFRVKLPNGTYEVHLCWDMFGLFATLPAYQWRKLAINGREVLSEKLTGPEFLTRLYLAHEDHEDLPGQDLWEKFIASYQKLHRFTAEVTDGFLRVQPQADNARARGLCFLVVYPEGKKEAGRKFMETLNAQRKARFNAEMVVNVPSVARTVAVRSPYADRALYLGFLPFVAHTEEDVGVHALPRDATAEAVVVEAAQGERQAAQVGIYPLANVANVAITPSKLSGPGGSEIPATAIQIRKVRNFLKGVGHSRMGNLLPYILQEFQSLDLKPDVTRAIWLTITVPETAAPGKYAGSLKIAAGAKSVALPIELTVHPFKLDRVTDITMSVTGSTAGHFTWLYPELEDRWWQIAEMVMKDQAEHGMNAITGGPSAVLKGIKDGKPQIDYTRMDRWMALAVKHGLTMPGDSYQGLDVSGIPHDHGKDCVAKCEAASKERFGVSYEELLRIVYADVERHAKEQGWPKRVYYFLDEPRPEYGNIESAAELIRIRTRACPNTLFSGYYSTGSGRDVYFETMPVSISHIDRLSLDLVAKGKKQIWDYSGSRVRHDIGRWAFVAARAGMKGFLRNGYMYVCSQPYFDFSDDEASWCVVYPSKNGISDTVGWERTAQGVNDYRYLLTCERLVRQARASGKVGKEVDAAEAFLKAVLSTVMVEDKESAKLSPRAYDEFRRALARHIALLTRP
jgi:hypothetical protein